jgi:hypothetical protein
VLRDVLNPPLPLVDIVNSKVSTNGPLTHLELGQEIQKQSYSQKNRANSNIRELKILHDKMGCNLGMAVLIRHSTLGEYDRFCSFR